jgi:dienelactone hydrolase
LNEVTGSRAQALLAGALPWEDEDVPVCVHSSVWNHPLARRGGGDGEESWSTTGIPHDLKVYPGAKHAFFNDTLSNYHPGAAADSWQRVLAFFTEHVKSRQSTSG